MELATYAYDAAPRKFTSKERDSESGLDNFDFRYYSSSMGRFMKPDDTEAVNSLGNPQGLNLYSYVQNNPVNATDPDGHDCIYINNDTGKYEGGWRRLSVVEIPLIEIRLRLL